MGFNVGRPLLPLGRFLYTLQGDALLRRGDGLGPLVAADQAPVLERNGALDQVPLQACSRRREPRGRPEVRARGIGARNLRRDLSR